MISCFILFLESILKKKIHIYIYIIIYIYKTVPVVAIEKRAFGSPSNRVANFTYQLQRYVLFISQKKIVRRDFFDDHYFQNLFFTEMLLYFHTMSSLVKKSFLILFFKKTGFTLYIPHSLSYSLHFSTSKKWMIYLSSYLVHWDSPPFRLASKLIILQDWNNFCS